GARKEEKRQEMLSDISNYLPADKKLTYLGLEAVNFKSYISLQKNLEGRINPTKSLVVEYDDETADAMKRIVANNDVIEGGEIFEGLTIENDLLHNAVKKHKNKSFDVMNLDYMGGWSKTKEKALEYLFENGQIADNALLYLTLLNSNTEKGRIKNGCFSNGIGRKKYGTDDQRALVEGKLMGLCEKHGYDYKIVRCEEYFDTQRMLFFGFHLEKQK
ncbi:hypothetical protein KY339_02485, partial [Candidatus Woesearchaeota archaeon]|nr:hypothetical protein [Candidatus Woesearchaeota archaeon]